MKAGFVQVPTLRFFIVNQILSCGQNRNVGLIVFLFNLALS